MSPLFDFLKKDDKKTVSLVEHALSVDPRISNAEQLEVVIKGGVVTIKGTAPNEREKLHAEEVVRNTLRGANVKYNLISNQVTVNVG